MQLQDLCAKCHQPAQIAQGHLFCARCEGWLCPKCNNPLPQRSTYCQCNPRLRINIPSNPPPKVTGAPQRGAYSGHSRLNASPQQQPQPQSEAREQYQCPLCKAPAAFAHGQCPNYPKSCLHKGKMEPVGLRKQTPHFASTPMSKPTDIASHSDKSVTPVSSRQRTPPRSPTLHATEGPWKPNWKKIGIALAILLIIVTSVFLVTNHKLALPNLWQHVSKALPPMSPTTISKPIKTYTLSTSVLPEAGGEIRIVSPSSSSGIFEPGSQVTLMAIPKDCYTFSHWDGASGSSDTATITMDSDKSVTAHFKVKDTTPPVISSIEVSNISEICATIIWKTDDLANSQVEYGKTDAYDLNGPAGENLTTEHNIRLIGLKSNTIYHFRVISKNACQLQAKSTDRTFETTYPQPAQVGNRAPDFVLQQMSDNSTVVLSDFRGKKGVLLNLWATACTGCVLELPYIQDIYVNHADLAVITVCLDKSVDNISNFIEKHPELTFPILVNKPSITARDYNIRLMPTTFFIDSNGIIREIQVGSFKSAEQIEERLKSID
jgi:peroxiredoxin